MIWRRKGKRCHVLRGQIQINENLELSRRHQPQCDDLGETFPPGAVFRPASPKPFLARSGLVFFSPALDVSRETSLCMKH
jgi:hypothetical protein